MRGSEERKRDSCTLTQMHCCTDAQPQKTLCHGSLGKIQMKKEEMDE